MPFNDCECALIVVVDSPQEPDERLATDSEPLRWCGK